tara:strand:+ start:15144 stop:15761 length:618 start_codon:yes stop_codon:yes gene_type:complete
MKNSEKRRISDKKKNLIEWGVILGVIAILYITGLHTQVIGTMQQALLWTGLMDANLSEVIKDGTFLSDQDYHFIMATADDDTLTLNEIRGSVIFVNVWASWCPPCIAEMPTIETLYNELKDHEKIRFILLSMDEEQDRAVNFMENREFKTPYLFPKSQIPTVLRGKVLPTTYIISKDGQVIYEKRGLADYSSPEFRDWLIELSEE